MHYTGNLDKFEYLHSQFKKAIEFQATVETMAYTICKTKPLAINAAQPTFNKICEKICSNIDYSKHLLSLPYLFNYLSIFLLILVLAQYYQLSISGLQALLESCFVYGLWVIISL